jgi:hypothetical protein
VVSEVAAGAVSRPVLEIDPALVDQVTAVLLEPVTAAVNCCVPPELTLVLLGEMEIATPAGGVTVTVAEEDTAVLAWLVACTVTFIVEVQPGAVYCPELEIVPALAVQVTAWLKLPVPCTLAVHCAVAPVWSDAGLQETETEATLGVELELVSAFPTCATPHEICMRAVNMTHTTISIFIVLFIFLLIRSWISPGASASQIVSRSALLPPGPKRWKELRGVSLQRERVKVGLYFGLPPLTLLGRAHAVQKRLELTI